MTAAGFRIRRIQSEQSIGDKLKRSRVRKKISISEAEESTRIRAKFILALESDSWEQIPSEVYGRGYLERYLDYLKIPKEPVMKQYDRERALYARHCKDTKVELAVESKLRFPRFTVTPRSVLMFFSAIALVGIGTVLTYQLKEFTSSPFLEIAPPVQAQVASPTDLVVDANEIDVTGRTVAGARVKVNTHEVAVADDGRFTEKVRVQKGVNAIVVEATSPNGKMTSEVLTVTVK